MDYKFYVLSTLLDKYENSVHFKLVKCNRRVFFDCRKEKELKPLLESSEESEAFENVINKLKDERVITVEYFNYNNLIGEISLNLDEDSIRKAYSLIDREPLVDILLALEKELKDTIEVVPLESKEYLQSLLRKAEDDRKLPRVFKRDKEFNKNLISVFREAVMNVDILTERVFSIKVLGDSKIFENEYRQALISMLRHISDRELSDNEILEEQGIVRYPEVIEFAGNIAFTLKDGSVVDCSKMKWGAYINSDMIKQVIEATIHADSILFVENKANYYNLLPARKDNEIIVFHGGVFSPIKGKFFSLLKKEGVIYRHWSDIDWGGFRIFTRLRDTFFPDLIPYKMDDETLLDNIDKAKHIEDMEYINMLSEMLKDEKYNVFHSVIQTMIDQKIRLEQECLE